MQTAPAGIDRRVALIWGTGFAELEAMDESYSDEELRTVLTSVKTFACVGVSANPVRPSYFVGRYLSLKGYRVIPVNPAYAESTLFGERVVKSLESIPENSGVEVVDIFRRSEEVPAIVNSALRLFPDLKVIWMQIGVKNAKAAALARNHGIKVFQNRCPKIEYQRLFWELRMAGFNTGIISSKI